MESEDLDVYLIYDNRLTSFTTPQPIPAKQRRTSSGSTHSRAPKALSWPHKSIKPADMAKAGFIFQPLPSNPDNVSCFLCSKALDGWEPDDKPLEEHLRHAPECGWAITAAVEAELGEYATEDPRDPLMVEARMATFAGRWPHEGRKGWICKTKQMVEAGWKYTPLIDSDDNATCAYCQLALDGWEKTDNPWDEHYSRAPNCAFFSLISSKPAPKRAGRSKAARSSKASRLSLQSVAAAVSDMPSVADMTADIDDSVVTTASKASKKTTKGKKTATSRAKKTRAKKEEAVDILEDEPAQEEMPPPPPPKPSQSNKRSSDEVEDSVATNAEAPAPKKRATKTRKAHDSSATEVSQADTEMTDAPEPAEKPATKATRKASGTRKASARSTRQASVATTASTVSPPPQIPDDNEIDRQLQADLDRPLTDDEDGPKDADPQTKKAAAARKRQSAEMGGSKDDLLTHTSTTDFAMFDPAPAHPSDAQIEADLRSMKDEMVVGQEERQPAPDELKIPKKGRKAGTRKASKQTTTKRAKEVAAPVEQPQPRVAEGAEEPDELADAEVSIVSSSTVVRRSVGRASLGSAAGPSTSKPSAKRGRPPKKKVSQGPADEPAEVAAPPEPVVEPEAKQADKNPTPVPTEEPKKRISTGKRGRPSNKSKTSGISLEEPTIVAPSAEPEPEPVGTIVAPPIEPEPEPVGTIVAPPIEPEPESVGTQVETEEAPVQENFSAASGSPRISRKPVPAPKDSPFAIQRKPIGAAPVVALPPKTPGHHASPVQSAKQATVSPSPSPQASDAENRPPSSKPDSNNSKGKRMPLGELPVTTPARQVSMSPSKQQRNVIGGLQSTENWTAVDLDLIFEDQTNASVGGATDRFFAKGGELTDEERNMTVEEWIYHNAGQAEQKLKYECETMVMAFEREGTRAMKVLEGLVVE